MWEGGDGGSGVHNTIHTYNQFGISFNRAIFRLLINALLLGFLLKILASFQILGNWK